MGEGRGEGIGREEGLVEGRRDWGEEREGREGLERKRREYSKLG